MNVKYHGNYFPGVLTKENIEWMQGDQGKEKSARVLMLRDALESRLLPKPIRAKLESDLQAVYDQVQEHFWMYCKDDLQGEGANLFSDAPTEEKLFIKGMKIYQEGRMGGWMIFYGFPAYLNEWEPLHFTIYEKLVNAVKEKMSYIEKDILWYLCENDALMSDDAEWYTYWSGQHFNHGTKVVLPH